MQNTQNHSDFELFQVYIRVVHHSNDLQKDGYCDLWICLDRICNHKKLKLSDLSQCFQKEFFGLLYCL